MPYRKFIEPLDIIQRRQIVEDLLAIAISIVVLSHVRNQRSIRGLILRGLAHVSHNRERSQRFVGAFRSGSICQVERQIVPDIRILEFEGSITSSGYLSDPSIPISTHPSTCLPIYLPISLLFPEPLFAFSLPHTLRHPRGV